MKDRTLIIVIIISIFSLYLLGNHLGLSGNVVLHNRYCTDSDSFLSMGDSIFVAGRVETDIGVFHDRCNTGYKSVREYYCTEGYLGGKYKAESRIIRCGSGFRCEKDVDGVMDACVTST